MSAENHSRIRHLAYLPILLFMAVAGIDSAHAQDETNTLPSTGAGLMDTGNPEADTATAADAEQNQNENPEQDPTANEESEAARDAPAAEQTESAGKPEDAALVQQRELTMQREITLVVSCEGEGVCREQATSQPLRVLPKSFSNVYKSRESGADNIAIENITAYKALYVFARDELDLSDPAEAKGWYQVSRALDGPALGWMLAQDVVEWKQALIVSYRHRGLDDMQREPVLMFRSLDALREIVESPVREGMTMLLYKKVANRDIPESVASKEPERYVDIDQKFYLLPILDFEISEIDGDEMRYLQLAAAVPRQRGADVLADEEYQKEAETKPEMTAEKSRELKMDIIFVMDMTRSMQPYIDRTRDAIRELAQEFADSEFTDSVRFGLVGYRDDIRAIPALEFTSKNFTPELVDVQSFLQLLDTEAQATLVGSVDYPEEVFAGVQTGLESAWTEGALRFLFLVGDASAHEGNHEQSTTKKNAAMLNLAARDAGVRVQALHLLDPRMPPDHAIAAKQFTTLSKIEGAEESALVQLSTEDQKGFSDAVKDSASVVYDTLAKAREGSFKTGDDPGNTQNNDRPNAAQPNAAQPSPAQRSMRKLMDSALIEYLGKEANPPKDIVVWALDRDLANPILSALDVRVLLSKHQLSDLVRSINKVTKALAQAESSQQQFFDALQSVAGQTLKQPEEIVKAAKLAETGLLPAFIQSLPYKSEILSLSNEMYSSMTAEQRSAMENNLRAKVRQYQDINEQVDGWIALNEEDEDGSKVYPLRLEYLP